MLVVLGGWLALKVATHPLSLYLLHEENRLPPPLKVRRVAGCATGSARSS